jgi:hypothetical protein
VDEAVKQFPRHLDDDQAINVNLKKSIIHKSAYSSGYVKKCVLKAWLSFSVGQPLHKLYSITVDWSRVDGHFKRRSEATATDDMDIDIETLNIDTARQATHDASERRALFRHRCWPTLDPSEHLIRRRCRGVVDSIHLLRCGQTVSR